MHIFKVKLPFYPPSEIKCRLQNRVLTPISIKTVHIRRDLNDIGTGLPPWSRSNVKTAHILVKIKFEIQSPGRKGGLRMLPWMLWVALCEKQLSPRF